MTTYPSHSRHSRYLSLTQILVVVFGLLLFSPLWAHDFGGASTGGGGKPPPPDCDSKTMCCDDPGSGNPVSYLSGTERLRYADLSARGIYPINITRRYDSQTSYDSPLGYGWAFDHDRRLFEYPDNSVIIRAGCGRRHQFIFTGGAYQAVPTRPPATVCRETCWKTPMAHLIFGITMANAMSMIPKAG